MKKIKKAETLKILETFPGGLRATPAPTAEDKSFPLYF